MKEQRQFQVSPHMLFQTIYNQAGSIEKAILECLMNAVDAGATKVELELNTNGIDYTIVDNGKGFSSYDEIKNCFEVFGFDHGTKEENYRTYGTFGIGRAQLWAFSKNTWRTNEFLLDVDIKNKGLLYDLSKTKKVVNGCEITGQFYEKLSLSEINDICKELTKLALYLPIEFYLNGKLVNKKVEKCDWDFNNDKAYIKLTDSGDLKVYNQGVFVSSYPNWKFGKGGTIVSKLPLSLNTARNDILIAKCNVWKNISKFLSNETLKSNLKKEKLSDDQTKNLFYKWISKEIDKNSFESLKMFTDIKGKKVSLKKINEYENITVAPNKGSQTGENIYNSKKAFVLSPEILENLDLSVEEFVQYINKDSKFPIKYVPFNILAKEFSDEKRILENKDLTKKEKLSLDSINVIEKHARLSVIRVNGKSIATRNIVIGFAAQKNIHAWTDGSSYIAINQDFFNDCMAKGYYGMIQLFHVLVHEYLHDSNHNENHVHSFEFFESFHNIMLNADYMTTIQADIKKSAIAYGEKLVKNGFSLSRSYKQQENLLEELA